MGALSALSLAAKTQEGVLSASLISNQNIQLSPQGDQRNALSTER